MSRCHWVKFCLVFVSVLMLAACSAQKSTAKKKCSTCHSLSVAFDHNYPAGQWANIINAMKVEGMVSTAEEDKLILEYLTSK